MSLRKTYVELFFFVLAAQVIAVIGDVLLRLAAQSTGMKRGLLVAGGSLLYAAVGPLWFMVFARLRTFSSLLYYWPVGTLTYLAAGILFFRERPNLREWFGVGLGYEAKIVGG